MMGGYVFTGVCLLTIPGGIPHPADGGRVAPPLFLMGYPIPGQDRGGWGYSHPRSGQGVPIDTPSRSGPRSGWGRLGTLGYPLVRTETGWGTHHHDCMIYPHQNCIGYASIRTGWGNPPLIRRQSSTASTCYAAGSVPLVFTQEDFLVQHIFLLPEMGTILLIDDKMKWAVWLLI